MPDYTVRQNIIREAGEYATQVVAAGEQLGYWKRVAPGPMSNNRIFLTAKTSEGINLWFEPYQTRGVANVRCSLLPLVASVACQGVQNEVGAAAPDDSPTASVGIKRAPAVAVRTLYRKVVRLAVDSGVHAFMVAKLEGAIERLKVKDAILSPLSALGYGAHSRYHEVLFYLGDSRPEGWPNEVELRYTHTHGYRVRFVTEVTVSKFAQRLTALARPPEPFVLPPVAELVPCSAV